MSEMEENKKPDDELPEDEDELDSLNDEEKAAFDKIMAEISAATGDESQDTQNTTQSSSGAAGDDTPPAPAEEPEIPETPDMPEPVEDATAEQPQDDPLPEQDEESKPDLPETAETDPGDISQVDAIPEPSDALPPDGDDDELDAEQQAALDAIMAEIEGNGMGATTEEPEAPPEQAEAEAPAEPDAAEPPDPEPETPEPVAEQNDGDELDDDQQAALNQIMAEIESKRGVDREDTPQPAPEPQPEPESQTDDELDDDQQAALNQIMAEIESKRKGDNIPANSGTPKNESDGADADAEDDADPDEQAAMERIMAEIEAQKKGDHASSEDAEDGEGTVAVEEDGPQELSMDEFDNELSNLLASAEASGNEPDEPPVGETDEANAMDEDADESAEEQVEPPADDPPETPQADEVAILQEISAQVAEPPANDSPPPGAAEKTGRFSFDKKKTVKAVLIGLAYIPILVIAVGISYWAYNHFKSGAPGPTTAQTTQSVPAGAPPAAPAAQPEIDTTTAEPDQKVAPTHLPVTPPVPSKSPSELFAQLRTELVAARTQTQNKMADVRQLKSFYGRGVIEEYEKIEDLLVDGRIPTFGEAIDSKKIELALRAIQRRQVYMNKLETPLSQLNAISEELLYLERKTRMYEILNIGINGLPIAAFKDEVSKAIGSYLQYQADLSVDNIEATPTALKEIWSQVTAHLNKKANLLAQRAPLNRQISADICKGNFDRKYLLTAVSEDTAQCLIKWSGKDLYLNALTELTPEVARTLAQWEGEWLSLNGVRELSAESAQALAQWPGKRLSLNGLTRLSQAATAALSQWRGAQLEMVGLKSIGSWENYGTQLFLSEKLRQQIEEQVQ